MTMIRQSTARTILVGPVLDADGVAKTDEVVANIRVTKNGTVGSADGSTTLTHDHAGKYLLAMAAGDSDTVGVQEISLTSGTNDMPVARFNVVEEAVYDVMYAAGAAGPAIVMTAPTSSTQGAVSEFDLTAYQNAALGPFTFTATVAQTGDNHAFVVYDPEDPTTVIFQLTTGAGDIAVSGAGDLTITVSQDDTNTGTAGVWGWYLINTSDDVEQSRGSLTIEEQPEVES